MFGLLRTVASKGAILHQFETVNVDDDGPFAGVVFQSACQVATRREASL